MVTRALSKGVFRAFLTSAHPCGAGEGDPALKTQEKGLALHAPRCPSRRPGPTRHWSMAAQWNRSTRGKKLQAELGRVPEPQPPRASNRDPGKKIVGVVYATEGAWGRGQ